ncbi:potassium channel family protein [Mycobacterium sp. IDR2000157661]|uniref:potassium channel family protein n=1 Tax=Mycobacterium sp. IDR2000157661 TaxID=2867005 RepID=UPI001EEEF621|nr:potassium channel family protein [Mycobacterium sp. IDR2000157661]ULE34806.1 potassium channel family protein [Mycobacterium sp. IDR2000157661]
MDWVLTIAGFVLVLVVVRDVFQTLFEPRGDGAVTTRVMKLVWRVLRPLPARLRVTTLTGPLGMVAVIGLWAVGAVAGWALIYYAQMPEGFTYSSDIDSTRAGLLDSVYLSLVTIATLGFGDILPSAPWLRVLVPLQALFGFMLITAAVSWVLQIYPALHRRRVLALQLSSLREARLRQADPDIDDVPTDVLTDIAAGLVEARNDLTQYGSTYYFRDLDADTALAAWLGYAATLGEEAEASAEPRMRTAGAMLCAVAANLAQLLDREFLHLDADTAAVIEAYADAHGYGGRSAA